MTAPETLSGEDEQNIALGPARWAAIKARVAAAATNAGRDPASVTIVAVSKHHPAEAVRAAVAAGVADVGENYVQELLGKRLEASSAELAWHFIGRLQSNKVRAIAGAVTLIHAVESLALAQEIAKRSSVPQPILIAVNVAGEQSKGGVSPAATLELARAVLALPQLALRGLMTMPPPADDDAEAVRPYFAALRTLRDELEQQLGHPLPVLSMGMSGDFEVAIGEGATHVRIGTAIFGERG